MIGIIGAMGPEVETLKALMRDVQKNTMAGMTFLTGQLANKPVVLLQCGIGKVNAAVGCSLLLQTFRPERVINTGSAGGLLAGQVFGDVVISTEVLHHDVDVTAFGYAAGQVPGLPARYAADPELVALTLQCFLRLKETGELPAEMGQSTGLVGSGDIFVHQSEVLARLRARFPDLCAVEMESGAIAETCLLFSTPFVIIRALSDIAGKQSPVKFEEFLPLASKNSSRLVLELLKNLPS
jgi:adenosylhomocysteine nucleosidase